MANVVLDVSELVNFKERLLEDYNRENMLYDLARQMMEMVREVAKQNTPIKTGNLRKSWSTDNSVDKDGNLTGKSNNLMLDVSRKGNVYTVSIENRAFNANAGKKTKKKDQFYASFVEEGYHAQNGRWIPGHWMMRTGEIEAERNAQRMFDAIVQDWWRYVNGQ